MIPLSIKKIEQIKEVTLEEGVLSFEEFIAIAKYKAKIYLSQPYINTIQKARNTVDRLLEQGTAIYGVTTGFGDNVTYSISKEEAATLQQNLLRSHACSVGDPLSKEEVRAIILMIVLNTGKGYSGIKTDTICLLCDLLNHDLYPFAPGSGSVGYLSVEAHICLTLIGEGYFMEGQNKLPACEVLGKHQLSPIDLGSKEGLSLISGTTSITALSMLSLYYGMIAYKNIQLASAMAFESLKGSTKAFDAAIHQLKQHSTQQTAARHMNLLLHNSQICNAYRDEKVQDPYLLRTIPQILGSCLLLLEESYDAVMNEFYSVSDNPVIFPDNDSELVYMTGNFDGSYIGTHCDILAICFANLGNFVERFTDRMVNHHISNGLSPFLTINPGLNSGFMIPQYTQAALQNELKLLASPASVDSITTCAGQEDPVSMAYNAANKALRSSKKLIQMTGIFFMTATQAIEITMQETRLSPSPVTKDILNFIRTKVSFVSRDRYLYQDMEIFLDLIYSNQLVEIAESDLDLIL